MNELDDDTKNIIYYGDFDWINYMNQKQGYHLYLNKKEEIYNDYIQEECKKKNPIYFVIPKKLLNANFFFPNNLDISFKDFPWESYLIINRDLSKKGINTKQIAWSHWLQFGKKEQRAFSLINNTHMNKGRFGNLFFVNMFVHFLSFKYNLKCNYKYEDKFKELGIFFYKGTKTFQKNVLITKNNFLSILEKNYEPCNLIITNQNFFQNKDFCLIIKHYFENMKINKIIQDKNFFSTRYGKNNDLFIHIRLGDISDKTEFLLPYYEKLLSSINYDSAYLASDSLDNILCCNLIKKYNLQIISYSDIDTIMFGSTCNNIILSGGSFSWLIGFLAFYSKNINYPINNKKWYGDIFVYKNWIGN
jgi:hypothetical protein